LNNQLALAAALRGPSESMSVKKKSRSKMQRTDIPDEILEAFARQQEEEARAWREQQEYLGRQPDPSIFEHLTKNRK
jgi:hypothetical protein